MVCWPCGGSGTMPADSATMLGEGEPLFPLDGGQMPCWSCGGSGQVEGWFD